MRDEQHSNLMSSTAGIKPKSECYFKLSQLKQKNITLIISYLIVLNIIIKYFKYIQFYQILFIGLIYFLT